MLKNYIKIAWRSLTRNRFSSLINIGGLSLGMAVALLIGIWVYDEFTFDHYHQKHDRLVQVIQHQTVNGELITGRSVPIPLGYQLRKDFQQDFKHVVLVRPGDYSLSAGEQKLSTLGMYMQPEGPDMLTLRMLQGDINSLKDPSSVLLSASIAKALFGGKDPMNQLVKIDSRWNVKVSGVYEDLPGNTTLSEVGGFIAPWDLYMTTSDFLKEAATRWGNNSWGIIAELQPNASIPAVNARIRDLKMKGLALNNDAVGLTFKAQLFLQPMNDWHLYQEFKNGVNTGGDVQFVKMFILIGVFVLLLACINFMNLSTARSEKRAREVGIRKSIGSLRSQLIAQFYAESLLLAFFALCFALVIAQLALPAFNQIAGRTIRLPYTQPVFWLSAVLFTILTGLIAGSYPALYLSSFNPVKVLKGTFKAGRFASIPRKILVVTQFTVSVALIIGTLVIFLELRYSKDRPVGYSQEGLLQLPLRTDAISKHFEAFRHDLLQSGAVLNVGKSDSPQTEIASNYSDFSWPGKDPALQVEFGVIAVDADYGKTVGWQITQGNDFSRDLATSSDGVILNEAAVRFMKLQHPVGQTIDWGRPYRVIGVARDMVMQSPFEPARPTVFRFLRDDGGILHLRINPAMSISQALPAIKKIYAAYDPASPFDYHFTDADYAKKFALEQRIGSLAGVFTVLAILISCLGLFGMASFVAEQRKKEIGVRKVLGASVAGLWQLLSTEFVILTVIALVIAMPLTGYFMQQWLQQYAYRVPLYWWLFAVTGAGALLLTLLTVSWQSIKAALANPVESLKNE